jgi:hypothetical protein
MTGPALVLPLEHKTGASTDQPMDIPLAFRTFRNRCFRNSLPLFKPEAAFLTFVFVCRHSTPFLSLIEYFYFEIRNPWLDDLHVFLKRSITLGPYITCSSALSLVSDALTSTYPARANLLSAPLPPA